MTAKKSDLSYVRCVLASKGYALGDELNRGSFAVVMSAAKRDGKKPMAVKLIDKSKAPGDFVDKFLPKELSIMREMKHKNVIEMHEALDVGWMTCIFMEICQGGDLLGLICEHGFVDDTTARRVFHEIVEGLQYIHGLQVGHRDLKCENILLDKQKRVKVADFGFARYVVDAETKQRQLSQTYCGSAAYAAPEVLLGTPYNPLLSDLWSLGVVLYVMVCGVMPFDDSDHVKMVRAQREKNWKFNPDRKAGIPPPCRRVIRKMLEPDLFSRIPLKMILSSDWLKTVSNPEDKLFKALAGPGGFRPKTPKSK